VIDAPVPKDSRQINGEGNVGVPPRVDIDVSRIRGTHGKRVFVPLGRRFSVNVVNCDCVATVRGKMVREERVVNVRV